jgi:hypothetical protein
VRALGLLTLTVLAATALTAGCAQRICNGPNMPGPAIVLNVSPWQHAHHDTTHSTATLRGCVGKTCVPATGESSYLGVPAGQTITLAVTAIRDGVQVLRVSERITQVRHSVDGPCGTVTWWQTPVTLTAAGTLAT